MKKLLTLIAVLGLVGVIGCGKKDGEAKTDEKAAAEKPAGDKKEEKAAEKPAGDKKEEKAAGDQKERAAAEKPAGDKKVEKAAAKPAGDAGKLVGNWKIDIETLLKNNPEMQKQIEAKPESKAMMEGMMGSMTFEFTADTLIAGMGGKTNKASYTVKSTEGNKLMLETKAEGKDTAEMITVTFTDNDHVTMEKPGDKMKLALVRK